MPTSKPDLRGISLVAYHGGLHSTDLRTNAQSFELRADGQGELITRSELQAEAGDGRPVIRGTAVKAGVTGQFWFGAVRLAAGCWTEAAYKKNKSRVRDVMALISHDYARPIGRSANNTLDLTYGENEIMVDGIRLNPDDPEAMSLFAKVLRGEMTAFSIGFTIVDGEWIEAVDNGLDADPDTAGKEIDQFEATEISVQEVSVVAQGAYGGAECFPATARMLGEMTGADEITFRTDGTYVAARTEDEDPDTDYYPALVALTELGYSRRDSVEILIGMTHDEICAMVDAYESGEDGYYQPDSGDEPDLDGGSGSETAGRTTEPSVHGGPDGADDQPEAAAEDTEVVRQGITLKDVLDGMNRRGIRI